MKDKHIKMIYIGERFYIDSGTIMSPLYTEDGVRMDYGLVKMALSEGCSINIRPASNLEIEHYEKKLSLLKKSDTDTDG